MSVTCTATLAMANAVVLCFSVAGNQTLRGMVVQQTTAVPKIPQNLTLVPPPSPNFKFNPDMRSLSNGTAKPPEQMRSSFASAPGSGGPSRCAPQTTLQNTKIPKWILLNFNAWHHEWLYCKCTVMAEPGNFAYWLAMCTDI